MTNEIALPDDANLARFLTAASEQTAELDPEQVTLDIITRIVNAETVDDVFGGSDAIHARDFLGTAFTLLAIKFNPSTVAGAGPDFYGVMEGAAKDGEKLTITCGSKNVMAQAWKLQDMRALPVNVQIMESERPTKDGYRPMWLEKAAVDF